MDWNDVLPAERCSYVLGNPPFIGAKFMDDAQRDDARQVFTGIDWGSDRVLAQTLRLARQAGLGTVLLAERDDLDRPADLDPWR